MPKVTEEMVRNELKDIICSELNGEKYYSFDSVLYVIQRLATSWEAERLETQPGPPEDKIKAAMDILYDGKPNKWGREDYLHAMRSSDVKFVYDLLKETLDAITPPPDQPEPIPKSELNLDVSSEEARALHRVVRAMHDGNCPACGYLAPSNHFERRREPVCGREVLDHKCPNCAFMITAEEAESAMKLFRPFMLECVEIFEKWAAARKERT